MMVPPLNVCVAVDDLKYAAYVTDEAVFGASRPTSEIPYESMPFAAFPTNTGDPTATAPRCIWLVHTPVFEQVAPALIKTFTMLQALVGVIACVTADVAYVDVALFVVVTVVIIKD